LPEQNQATLQRHAFTQTQALSNIKFAGAAKEQSRLAGIIKERASLEAN